MSTSSRKEQLDRAIAHDKGDGRREVLLLKVGPNEVKISLTFRGAATRIHEFKLGNPYPIRLLACISGSAARDAFLKARFSHLWIERETFKDTPEIRNYFAKLA